MGFLSGLVEKSRVTKINYESGFVNKAFDRIPKHRRGELAAAFENEFEEIERREQEYLARGGIQNLHTQLDAGRYMSIASALSTDLTVSIRGMGAWFANAYKQTEISESPEMRSLHQGLHDVVQGMYALARE